MIEDFAIKTFESMTLECGLVVGLQCVIILFLTFLWWIERKDRRAAWKANNEFKKEMIGVMKEASNLLNIIKDRTER